MPRPAAIAAILALCCVGAVEAKAGPLQDPPERVSAASAGRGSLGSVHAWELARHARTPHRPVPRPALRPGRPKSQPAVDRTVYGYFPYWAGGFDEIQWDLLTHISYFAVEINGRGTAVASHGWPDEAFVATAHEHGVLVELAITLFNGPAIRDLCADPARRAAAVQTIVEATQRGGADGASIDFEGLLEGTRDNFSTFMEELRAGFAAAGQPDASLSIAGPAVDWTDAFDLARLLQVTDHYFVMGYGFHWSGSERAGPIGQLRVGPTWRPYGSLSMQRSLAYWSRLVPAELRARIVWGVPYYGATWVTDDGNLGASVIDHLGNPSYAVVRGRLAAAGGPERRWEAEAQNPWIAQRVEGAMRQTWYDDERSLDAKYRLIREQEAAVGMWALGYDQGYTELWDLLRWHFAQPAGAALTGTRARPVLMQTFPFADERDTRAGPGNYFNYYSCAPDVPEYGREWVYEVSVCQPGELHASVTDDAGVDVDLHILDAPTQDACLARHDAELVVPLQPGRYLLVVDSFVANHIEQAGPYALTTDFVPTAGSEGCAPGESCDGGECRAECPAEQAPCAGRCVDLQTNAGHCGRCGHRCDDAQVCAGGECRAVCPLGELLCEGACVDPGSSERHCGGCTLSCQPGEECFAGRCEPPLGRDVGPEPGTPDSGRGPDTPDGGVTPPPDGDGGPGSPVVLPGFGPARKLSSEAGCALAGGPHGWWQTATLLGAAVTGRRRSAISQRAGADDRRAVR